MERHTTLHKIFAAVIARPRLLLCDLVSGMLFLLIHEEIVAEA
jgi:hypothetical protein